MNLDIKQQVGMGFHSIVKSLDITNYETILTSVWQLRIKWNIKTGEVQKYKTYCNIDGSGMKYGEQYEQKYASVATWTPISIMLAMVLVHG